jgi:hypothetical protein
MKNLVLVLGLAVALAGCSRKDSLEIPTGSDVSVQKHDGVNVTGRLIEVKPEQIVVETKDGTKVRVPRADIATLRSTSEAAPPPAAAPIATTGGPAPTAEADRRATPPPVERAPAEAPRVERRPEYREFTVPAGTVLPLELTSAVSSETSNVEDPVSATLRNSVSVDGVQVLPAGTTVLGHVTSAQRSAKVKGRASIGFRFNQIDLPGDGGRERISTGTVSRLAAATKKKDATKIGVGAGAGAVIGGLLGGGDGAAKGAAIGGGAGTAAVLATRGEEIRLGAGTPVSVKLTEPLTVRVLAK